MSKSTKKYSSPRKTSELKPKGSARPQTSRLPKDGTASLADAIINGKDRNGKI